MENMRPVLMYENSIFIVLIERITRNMVPPVNHQDRLVAFLGNFPGNDCTGKTRPDN